MRNYSYLRAVASVAGFIIGAGIFGVPYIFSKSGYLPGMIELVAISFILILTHLLYGEVVLRTGGRHRLPGLAAIYLGRNWKRTVTFSNLLGAFGAMLAYTILGGMFFWQLLGNVLPIGLFQFQLIFFAVMAALVAAGLKLVSRVEMALTALLFITVLGIAAWGAPHVRLENFVPGEAKNLFLPFGVLLFALGGWASVPEAGEILGNNLKRLRGVIIWGTGLAAAVTAIFASVVLGVSGAGTTESAIAGLIPVLGGGIVLAGAVFGLLAIITSFLVMGTNLKETFEYDFRLHKAAAFALALGVPLILFLIGARSFINVISITGGVFGAIDIIIILLIYRAARKSGKRKPEYALRIPEFVVWPIIFIFLAGAVYELAIALNF